MDSRQRKKVEKVQSIGRNNLKDTRALICIECRKYDIGNHKIIRFVRKFDINWYDHNRGPPSFSEIILLTMNECKGIIQ